MEIYNLISSGKQKQNKRKNTINHNINGSVSPLSVLEEVLQSLYELLSIGDEYHKTTLGESA